MGTLWQDLRYGLRTLSKTPGFTLAAVLALSLGIGANSAIFSVANAVLLRPLPYHEPERLVMIYGNLFKPGLDEIGASPPEVKDYREQAHVFERLACYTEGGFNLSGEGEPERISGAFVSADLFPVLGVGPFVGRTFNVEEDQPGSDQVVVLSHKLWQRRFNADPGVVGKSIGINGKSLTVIGVMPAGFQFPDSEIEIWKPLALDAEDWSENSRGSHYLNVIARLKPGVTQAQAQTEVQNIAERIRQQHSENYDNGFGAKIVSRHEQVVGQIRPVLLILLGAVGFVLLIACANVANLLFARAATREREMAIRTALGAGRGRIIRQLLTESLLLAVAGGALGLLLALWGVDLLVALAPNDIPRLGEVGLDLRVLGFTVMVSLVTGVLFGLAPALRLSKPDLQESLKDGARGAGEGFRRQRMRNLLVVSEVALSLVLLIGAGLMIRSFIQVQKISPGFNPERVLTMRLSLPQSKYAEPQQQRAFFRQLVGRVEALPGVESVGAVNFLPLSKTGNMWSFAIEGRGNAVGPNLNFRMISPDYFRTIGIPLKRGRQLTEQDREGAPPVAVINETMARTFFPGEDPIGKRLKLASESSPFPWLSIVGVVGDVRHYGLDEEAKPELYVSYLQPLLPNFNVSSLFLAVRTGAEPAGLTAAVRKEVAALDKDQPIADIKTMEARLSDSVAPRRFNMLLLGIFAALALALSIVGIYGVMSYAVTQRTHEIGVRMALGAQTRDVLRLVVGQGMILALAGVALGLVGAFALTRVMTSLLFGVSPSDPTTFALVAIVLAAVALVACLIPARRATRIDPMEALRYE
ncbi:MAG TPA: ABC transporter permease [Pyrinomonadaceae bacterium]|jgi:putative ABC transport system permease protein|nr:ABC transporter permease [Pyrinomonadaceae bacterium]